MVLYKTEDLVFFLEEEFEDTEAFVLQPKEAVKLNMPPEPIQDFTDKRFTNEASMFEIVRGILVIYFSPRIN